MDQKLGFFSSVGMTAGAFMGTVTTLRFP